MLPQIMFAEIPASTVVNNYDTRLFPFSPSRAIDGELIKRLKRSMAETGMWQPIVVRVETMEGLAGNHRFLDPNTYRSVAPLRFVEDNDKAEELWNDFAQGNAIFVSGLVQQTYHIQRGDTLRLRTPRGERDLRVAGIVMDINQGGVTVIGSWNILGEYFGQSASGASAYFARLAPGADRAAVSIIVTLVVSQLAALYPTWRAVRAVVVQTIQSE